MWSCHRYTCQPGWLSWRGGAAPTFASAFALSFRAESQSKWHLQRWGLPSPSGVPPQQWGQAMEGGTGLIFLTHPSPSLTAWAAASCQPFELWAVRQLVNVYGPLCHGPNFAFLAWDLVHPGWAEGMEGRINIFSGQLGTSHAPLVLSRHWMP